MYDLYISYIYVCTSCANDCSICYMLSDTLRAVVVCLWIVHGYCTLFLEFFMQVVLVCDLHIFYVLVSTSCAIVSGSYRHT